MNSTYPTLLNTGLLYECSMPIKLCLPRQTSFSTIQNHSTFIQNHSTGWENTFNIDTKFHDVERY